MKKGPISYYGIMNKNYMKWGVVVEDNNWRFAGRNSYL